jgi:sec-independent protein translocase protein TatC
MPALTKRNLYDEYPDDIFKDSRMSFGDHLEELRMRMLRAIKYLLIFLTLGLTLDGIGVLLHNPYVGIGRPMMMVITDPAEEQIRDFYNRRNEKMGIEKLSTLTETPSDELAVIEEKYKKNDFDLSALSADERQKLLGAPSTMPVILPTESLAPAVGQLKPDAPKEIAVKMQVYPAYLAYLTNKGESLLGTKKYLSTMSFQEAFLVYFKVAILSSIVLASPFILWQFWAFVGAGLYPHERRYVHVFFGPSVALFLFGIILCQFFVLPGAIKALLGFNEWLGLDADIRLKEWLSLAIILPLVFGVSFQTPLVMVFFNRIGLFTAQDYFAKWRYACLIIVIFAAIVTPTPDAVTMLYLFLPMFGLYLGGAAVCYYFPAPTSDEVETEAAEEIAV